MKKLILSFLTLVVCFMMLSCNDEKKQEAEKFVLEYSDYIDSISTISTENIKQNWETIEKNYIEKKLQAQSSVETLPDNQNQELLEEINLINSKYEELKIKVQMETEKLEVSNDYYNELY